MKQIFLLFVLMLPATGVLAAADTLDIYFIDTEGGQATLVVSPSGRALMIDMGFAGLDTNNRDAGRIAAAAKLANITRIDVAIPTHFHGDHIGGIADLAAKVPIAMFLDDGPSIQDSAPLKQKAGEYSEIYAGVFAKGEHRVVKAGDKVSLQGLDVTIVASNGKAIAGAAEPNPFCAGLEPRQPGNAEDTESIGIIVQFGKFRFANLGDTPWNKELEYLCPQNPFGKIDVYETPRHGGEPSKAIYAMGPRVAVMDNGARKGGGAASVKTLMSSPGLQDVYQLHLNVQGGAEANAPESNVANLEEQNDQGFYLKLSANDDGSFTIYNPRDKHHQEVRAKKFELNTGERVRVHFLRRILLSRHSLAAPVSRQPHRISRY